MFVRTRVILFSRRNDMPNVVSPPPSPQTLYIIVSIEKVLCLHCMKNTSIDYTYANNRSDRFPGFVYCKKKINK